MGSENIKVIIMDDLNECNRLIIHHNPELTKYKFTKRELQILKYICDGKQNPEIAKLLFISPHTVKKHTCEIFHKFGVKNRVQAAAKAIECGIKNLDTNLIKE